MDSNHNFDKIRLRTYIEQIKNLKWILPTIPSNFRPTNTELTKIKNEKILGDVNPKKPNSYELEKTWKLLDSTWTAEKSLKELKFRDLKRGAWAIFYPPGSPELWLGNRLDFIEAYISWIVKTRRASCIGILIKVFLNGYPNNQQIREIWRSRIRKLLFENKSMRLKSWQRRCKKYFLLDSNGCAKFGGAFLKTNIPPDEILDDAGFDIELQRSEFLKEIQARVLRFISKRFKDDGINTKTLDRVFALLEDERNDLRFQEKRNSIPEFLLTPYIDADPSTELREQLLNFHLKHFQDPRIKPSNWQGINNSALEVMRRWLVGFTLKDFFRILDYTAYDKHWRYRSAFWSAYHQEGHISDAWVILGKKARRIAAEFLNGDVVDQYGTLQSWGGVKPDQSVLILKVGGITVSEWSHSGRCHLWLYDNESAPKFYQQSYSRNDLTRRSDFNQIHYASDKGTWQRRLEQSIEEQTGIHIKMIDYMPRESS